MERVWTYIAEPDPNPNPSASPCPTHESIYGHGCRSKSKPTGYPWTSMGLHTMYITIIILENFGNTLAIIIWTMEGKGSDGHGHGRFDCLVCLVGSK
jgi:hypothetical protein